MVSDVPLGRNPNTKGGKAPPGKATFAGGSRRRQIERYSPSYHNISYLSESGRHVESVGHESYVSVKPYLGESFDGMAAALRPHSEEIMLQQCDREQLMCLVFLATGLQPTSRIPACLD